MLYGEKLVKTLRKISDNVQKRFWVYTPYIGSWDGVKRIIGDNWYLKGNVDVRLLTDIRNEGWIDPETFTFFKKYGAVRTLAGLHAKIYLSDDQIIITSANLTRTAFQKRYEAGLIHKCTVADETYVNFLWKNAGDIPNSWKPKKQKKNVTHDEQGGKGLSNKCNLPEAPRGTGDSSYESNLEAFANFRKIYTKHVKRVWSKSPVYFEIDSFLNYLFHEHPNQPSHAYKDGGHARLSLESRIRRVKKYHILFRNWLKNENADYPEHREKYNRKIRKILSPAVVQYTTWKDIENALSHVWAFQGNPLNKAKFFNRGTKTNNTLPKVRESFRVLFDDHQGSISSRFRYCKENLVGLGPGAIGELIGYYYPDQFPLINNNTLSGLRFLGYDV